MIADLRRTLWMTVPGVLGLVATSGLVAGFIGSLSSPDASKFVIFVQIELLAMGVARLGLEQLVLSRAAALDDPERLVYTAPLVRLVLPAGVAIAAVLALVLRDVRGAALVLVVPLDIMSSVVAAFELGRRRFAVPIILGWLNYPLFLVLVLGEPIIGVDGSSLAHVVALFVTTSLVRGAVGWVLLARHHRRVDPSTAVHLHAREATGSGAVNVVQTLVQRLDGVVLSACAGRFGDTTVASYLLSTRLLDASYAMSSIVGSIRQVSRSGGGDAPRGIRRWAAPVAWFGLWSAAAVALAVTARSHGWRSWPELALATIGASLFVATVTITLDLLGSAAYRPLVRRHLGYLAVFLVAAASAIATGIPRLMLIAPIGCGLASLTARRTPSGDTPRLPGVAARAASADRGTSTGPLRD